MKSKFCANCGRETEELYDSLCKKCLKERKDLVEVPGKLEVEACKDCGRVKISGEWKELSLEEAIEKILKKSVETAGEGSVTSLMVEVYEEGSRVVVSIEGEVNGMEMEEEREVKIEMDKTTCDICSKRRGGYFEAVVQIRDGGNIEEALEISEGTLKNLSDRKGFISDVKEVENGVDIYLGSKSAAKKIAKNISENFETERKSAKSLQGEKDGQRIYRSTYLVRILE